MSELDNFNNPFDSQDVAFQKDLITPEVEDFFNPDSASDLAPLSQLEEISSSDYRNNEGILISSNLSSVEDNLLVDEQFIVNNQAVLENFEQPEANLLERSLALSNSKLERFLNNPEAFSNLHLAFGDDWNPQEALILIKDLITEKAIPEISLLPAATLQGRGAFDGQKIYLAEELFDSENSAEISNVFLEEFGHYLDSRLNTTDSEGDEGEIFSKLIQNLPLDLATLKLEDDLKIINLDGQKVAVESADLPGIFTVDNSGKISVDWMADAGSYKGELAIFSLTGMDNLTPGSTEYIQEASRRALSNTTEGYVVLSDTAAGAKLNGELGERNFNRGDYAGISEFNFTPGTKVALFLVPVGTVKQVFDNPTTEDQLCPLFSVATANPEGKTHLGQLTAGTFGWEDIRFDDDTDADYNDIIVHVQGLSGFVTPIEQLISSRRDWLNSETAQEIISLVQGESIDSEGVVTPVVRLHLANDSGSNNQDLITNDPEITVKIDNRDSLAKLEIQLNDRSWLEITDTVTAEGLVSISQAQLRELNNGELGDGDYQFAIRATDTENNVATPITLDFTLDTTAPKSPTQLKLSNDQDLVTSNNQPVITGVAPKAATVKLYSGESLIGEGDLVDGTWQIATNKIFAEGKQPLNAVAIDAAGNLSTPSNFELLIDTIAPQLMIASPQYESQIASGSRLQGTVNGTGSEIVQLSYQFNDLPSGSINMNGGATFAGDSLLANNSSNGNIIFSGATNTINASDELKVISAGSITFNGASETRGKFISGGNLTFSGNSTLYGAIAAKGNISFNGNATVVGVNSNSAPSDLSLNPTTSPENVANNSVIGTFTTTDTNSNDTHVLSLVAGTGDTNNNAFSIVGNQLRINDSSDFESLSSHSIRVRTTDNAGASFEKVFTVNITNVNEAPTQLNLSTNSIAENSALGTTIGNLSTIDPDANNTHTYSLVTGSGDADNAAFAIVGNKLNLNNAVDFEGKSNYSIRLRTTDAGGLNIEQVIKIDISDVNEAPTEIALSNVSINENVPLDSVVGIFKVSDPDLNATHDLSLVAGEGDRDNAAFTIVGNQLRIKSTPDFESKASYNLRVKVTDVGGLSKETTLTITVNDLNEVPTDLSLSSINFNENLPASSEIATLHTVDPDAGDTHTLSLVAGEGDTDNNAFRVSGDRLYFKDAADFETKANYNLRVLTTDAAGNSLEKILYLNVNNVNEAPTDITLSAASVAENSPIETIIATLGSSDPDAGDTHTYSLVAGEGDTDNSSFNLVGDELRLNHKADFESQSNYSIRIRATDAGGLFKDEMVTISVQDSLEAEIALNLNLTQDTGADNTDRLTSDPTISGTVENGGVNLTLSASLNGAKAIKFGDLIEPDGSFTLGIEQLKLINNGDLEDGSYTLQLIATDSGSGKTIERELAFTLDTSAPTLNLITPLADGDHSSKARLTGTVTEDDLADLTYSLDGGEIGAVTVDAKGHFNSEIDPNELELSTHTVKAIATDIAGNQTTTEVSFEVGDNFLTPEGTKGWGAKNDSSLILGEQDSYVVETSIPVELGLAANQDGEPTGTRTISFDVDAVWDKTDLKTIEDQLLVYLVDPANPDQTLLDSGTPGSAVFSLAEEQSDFTPGLVSFDGKTVTIDASSLTELDQGLLVFQLLNQDNDTSSVINVSNLASTTDLEGFVNPIFPEDHHPVAAGKALNLANLTPAADVETLIEKVRFDPATGEYKAWVSIKNNGDEAISRNSAVVFKDLPNGVKLAAPSGTDSQGNPYINLYPAIYSGGLSPGAISEPVEIVLNNPNLVPFGLDTAVLVGSPNVAPVWEPIGNLTVVPGEKFVLPLAATDPNGDNVTYRLKADDTLPTGTLEGNGTLKFNPKPDEIGSYEFTIIATDGVEEVSQTVTLDVVADPITTTRISGVIENVEQQPLAGVVIELGELETVTAADGSFTLETDQPLTADTLKVRGEDLEGDKVYPFIAEKLPLVLGQEVYEGYSNVIERPIYLPMIDIASGKVIDPNKDITVTSENIPKASVFVEAGSLITSDGADFKGTLSITEVPTELTPAALPENVSPDLVVTIQPGEMVFTTPAPLSLPNRAGWAAGLEMDLWSINPATGDFDKVGKGKVSDDGSKVETIEGGIRNSSWHLFAPPPEPIRPPEEEQRNEDNKCPECKASCGFNSEVEYHSGAVIETHDLTTYSSNGSERGITLTYDSLRANPRPIIHFGYDDTLLDGQLKLVADLTIQGNDGFNYQVPGSRNEQFGVNPKNYWSVLNHPSGHITVGLQADMQEQPSGLYHYTVNSGLYQFIGGIGSLPDRFFGSSADSSGDFIQVNTIDSDFGSGWSIAGWQEIVENSDRSVLLIDGDGSELLFEAPPDEEEGYEEQAGYVSPPGDFSTLEKLPDGTFRRTMKDQMVYKFNSANDLESVTDRNGNQTSYQYNSQEQLIKIVDPVGLATVLSYNAAGQVSKITDPGVRVTQLQYDAAGNLTRIIDPDGATRTWSYDVNRLMVGEIDERGKQERATYDQFGRAESAQLKDGSTVKIDPLQTQGMYSPEATLNLLNAPPALIETKTPTTAYVDENGNVTVTEVDKAGQTVSAFDGSGQLPSIDRNQQNLISQSTDGRGNETKYTYDELGNVLTIKDSLSSVNSVGGKVLIVDGAVTSSEPQLSSATTATIESLLRKSGFDATISDNIPQDISEYKQVWDLRFDNSAALSGSQTQQYVNFLKTGGNLFLFGENSAFKSRNSSVLNLIEQAGGGKLNFVRPSESQQFLAPFNSSNPITDKITFKAPGGVTSPGTGQFIAIDERDRGVGVAFGRGSLRNAAAGELTALFDLGFLSDASNNLNLQNLFNLAQIKTKSALQAYNYDPLFNQVTSYTDELSRLTLNDLDPNNGNLLATTRVVGQVGGDDDLTTSYTYTSAGLVDTMTDPMGRVTDYQYDRFGRLVKEISAIGTADEATVQYEYNAVGNQTAVIDENGNRTEFKYDQKNRVTKITEADPDGVGDLASPVTSLTYDKSGNVVKEVDANGNPTLHKYDELNRLIKTTNSLGESTSYEYDKGGNVSAIVDHLGRRTENRYDSRDRLIQTIDPLGNKTKYKYDLNDNLIAVTDPLGNKTASFYDSRDRLFRTTDVEGNITNYEYDAADNLVATVDGKGNRTEFEYDELNRQVKQIDAVGGESAIAYDQVGNVIATTDEEERTTELVYDSRDRLIQTTDAENGVASLEYDDVGNVIATTDQENRTTNFKYDALNRQTSITDPLDNVTTSKYDANGNLIFLTDANNHTTNFKYDALNRPEVVTNAAGDKVTTSYDGVGNVTSVTDELGRSTRFTYDERNLQTSITDPLNHTSTTKYDAVGNVDSVTDARGNTTNYEYDELNRLIKEIDANQQNTTYQYDAVGNLLGVSDRLDRTTNFAYDQLNRQTSITDPLDNTTTNQYDKVGNLTSVTDANNHTTDFAYDQLNRQTGITNALGDIFSTEYDAVGNVTAVTDQEGRTTEFAYDERNRQTSITNALNNTTATEYDAVGNVSAITDARGNSTLYEYDELNRQTVVTNALGDQITTEYDAVDNVTAITDELGRTTELVYDGRNLQTSVTDPLGQTTTSTYDPVGNLLSVTDANNHTTSYQYDELNRQTVVTNALGDQVTTEYDPVDNVTAVTDELDRTTELAYDGRNLQTSITDPLGQTTTSAYDPVGNLLSVTDPLNLATSFTYDALNRRLSTTNPQGETTAYTYDAVGNQLSIIDPENNTTSYTYDDLNRTLTDTNQLGDPRSYQYDAVGNLVKTNDRNGRVINYQFDKLNRNTAEVWLDANNNPVRTFDFEYDAASQLTNAQDPDSAYGYEYDQDGRVTSVDNAGTEGVPNVVLDYTYDPVDNLTQVKDSIDGVESGVETFGYDPLDRVTKITQSGNGVSEKRVDMSYDAADQMTDMTRYSDLAGTEEVAESNYTFDDAGRLTDIVHQQNAATLAEFNLKYDQGDRITQFTTPDGVSDFTYDDTDQLVDASHSYQDHENFTYDDNGNRTNTGYVTGENNQLTSDGTYNYQYDGEGNRTKQTEIATGEVTEYQWDHRNRLVGVETKNSAGNVVAHSEYQYDVFDRRIAKSVDSDGDGAAPATQEHFVYDGDHIALTFDGEGNQTERFLHGTQIDQVLAQENANGEVLWALTDHQNSVRVVLDHDGKIVNQISYDSFGQITNETHSNVDLRFGYTGRELDLETGLYYNRARYYDPAVGEFVSEDPIGFAAGDGNLYRYVGNNPLFYLDPTGFCGVAASGEPEFFGPAFGPDSNPGGPPTSLDDFGGDDFEWLFGGRAEALTIQKALENQKRDSSEEDGKTTDIERDIWWYEQEQRIERGADRVWEFLNNTGEDIEQKVTTGVEDIWGGLKDLWNGLTKGDKSNEFDSTIIDVFDGDLGISSNVEKFPKPDDFLKGDTFTFPGENISFDKNKPIPDFDDDLKDLLTDVFDIRITNPKKYRENANPEPGYQVHHNITDKAAQNSELTREALERGQWDIDGSNNLINLPSNQDTYNNSSIKIRHYGSHPNWNNHSRDVLNSTQEALEEQYGSLDNVPDNVLKNELNNIENRLRNDLNDIDLGRQEGWIKKDANGLDKLSRNESNMLFG